jgi:hypothetical protein
MKGLAGRVRESKDQETPRLVVCHYLGRGSAKVHKKEEVILQR